MKFTAGRLVGACTLTALVAGAAVAAGAIPDGGGTVHSCYAKVGGLVRIVDDASSKCTALETPLNWSQAGPPGKDGAPGTSGYQVVWSPSAGVDLGFAYCPEGKVVVGGGARTTSAFVASGPEVHGRWWYAEQQHVGDLEVYAICMNAPA